MINQSELVAGARIQWTSQAGGFTATKSGKLVAFIPKNKNVSADMLVGDHRLHGQTSSRTDRYLVLLDSKSVNEREIGKGRKKNHYYVPVASIVQNGKLLAASTTPVASFEPGEIGKTEIETKPGQAFDVNVGGPGEATTVVASE